MKKLAFIPVLLAFGIFCIAQAEKPDLNLVFVPNYDDNYKYLGVKLIAIIKNDKMLTLQETENGLPDKYKNYRGSYDGCLNPESKNENLHHYIHIIDSLGIDTAKILSVGTLEL